MSNLVRYLRQLTPPPALLVAEVIQVNADNTSTVRYPDGSEQRVRGTQVGVGQPAFVRAGLIEGRAPSLTVITIEI